MGVWYLTALPQGKKAIPCKWVFKRKLNADGSIVRYKARLVIKGFYQKEGIDFNAAFAPVVRASTVRLFLSIVACNDMDPEFHSIDIKNAFIQGTVAKRIPMRQPPGYDDGSGCVCIQSKSLYGLKQAPRVWNETLTAFIISLGFVQCKNDAALFMLWTDEIGIVLLLCYVVDIQIAALKLCSVQFVKKELLSQFPGKDAGISQFFLQMTITRDRAA